MFRAMGLRGSGGVDYNSNAYAAKATIILRPNLTYSGHAETVRVGGPREGLRTGFWRAVEGLIAHYRRILCNVEA